MGNDLSVVNAARVSYDKESSYAINGNMYFKDIGLLNYLATHDHTSPFRHATLQFEIYAPLFVMRQWGKYRVGSVWSFEDSDDPIEAWNESSRRYVTEKPVFYIPTEWRSAPENSKQGSGDPLPVEQTACFTSSMGWISGFGLGVYEQAMEAGICPEQARLLLPAYAMYVRARWTVSLHGVLHFLHQRLEEDAQFEIREYAAAVRDLSQPLYPESFKAFGFTNEEETS